MGLTEDFAELFQGRKDAFGTEEGGAVRIDAGPFDVMFKRHLEGIEPIGVYPMVYRNIWQGQVGDSGAAGWVVRWGCVDLDVAKPGADYATEAEAHEAAENIVAVLESFGVKGWIERTRSGGRHVWVFASEWVPAPTMRRALLVACGIAEASTREVNPKQESLNPDQLGNYVRLPYPGGVRGNRYVWASLDEDIVWPGANSFVPAALAARCTAAELDELARLWTPPTTVKPVLSPETRAAIRGTAVIDVSEITPKLGGLAYTVWRDGPLDGGDRSTTLARLAHLCREDGLTPEEALAILESADLEWGKFWQRRDGVRQLEKMIERAYADFDDLE